METTQAQATVASATPGRVRIRLQRTALSHQVAHRVKEHVGGQDGVTRVDANTVTGSVVVHYNREMITLDDVIDMFRDVGVIVGSIAGLEGVEELSPGTPASRRLIEAVDRLDRRLAHVTGHRVDLRLLFPASLFALGIRQVLVEGLGLSQVPGYVLLWYAFDSFWKLHRELPLRGEAGVGQPTSDPAATTTLDATIEAVPSKPGDNRG
jgi:Heavy metal associated domain 2